MINVLIFFDFLSLDNNRVKSFDGASIIGHENLEILLLKGNNCINNNYRTIKTVQAMVKKMGEWCGQQSSSFKTTTESPRWNSEAYTTNPRWWFHIDNITTSTTTESPRWNSEAYTMNPHWWLQIDDAMTSTTTESPRWNRDQMMLNVENIFDVPDYDQDSTSTYESTDEPEYEETADDLADDIEQLLKFLKKMDNFSLFDSFKQIFDQISE